MKIAPNASACTEMDSVGWGAGVISATETVLRQPICTDYSVMAHDVIAWQNANLSTVAQGSNRIVTLPVEGHRASSPSTQTSRQKSFWVILEAFAVMSVH